MLIPVPVKGLSQPTTKLIETVSAAVGTLYEPTRMVREAKAQSKAAIIFEGVTADGHAARLIQHVQQLNLVLLRLPREDNSPPRQPIGFSVHNAIAR